MLVEMSPRVEDISSNFLAMGLSSTDKGGHIPLSNTSCAAVVIVALSESGLSNLPLDPALAAT